MILKSIRRSHFGPFEKKTPLHVIHLKITLKSLKNAIKIINWTYDEAGSCCGFKLNTKPQIVHVIPNKTESSTFY